jgi:DNA (cytosine-5)-methyltransferase 1
MQTYRANFPGITALERDIQTVRLKQDDLDPVDVLHAGFPCQSFSQAGSRHGFEDPRGQLFYEIIRIISEFKDTRECRVLGYCLVAADLHS